MTWQRQIGSPRFRPSVNDMFAPEAFWTLKKNAVVMEELKRQWKAVSHSGLSPTDALLKIHPATLKILNCQCLHPTGAFQSAVSNSQHVEDWGWALRGGAWAWGLCSQEAKHSEPVERELRSPWKRLRQKACYMLANHPTAVMLFTVAGRRIVLLCKKRKEKLRLCDWDFPSLLPCMLLL